MLHSAPYLGDEGEHKIDLHQRAKKPQHIEQAAQRRLCAEPKPLVAATAAATTATSCFPAAAEGRRRLHSPRGRSCSAVRVAAVHRHSCGAARCASVTIFARSTFSPSVATSSAADDARRRRW